MAKLHGDRARGLVHERLDDPVRQPPQSRALPVVVPTVRHGGVEERLQVRVRPVPDEVEQGPTEVTQRCEETIAQIHPDADSMRTHLAVMADHGHATAEYLDFSHSTSRLYGAPDEELIAQVRDYGIPVTVARPGEGFNRLPPG